MIPAADLRRLAALADKGGADAAWLERIMGKIIELELCADPRRLEAMSLKRQVRAADKQLRRAGITAGRIAILATRFRRSRSRIHALLEEDA